MLKDKLKNWFVYEPPEELVIKAILIAAGKHKVEPEKIAGHILGTMVNEQARLSRMYIDFEEEEANRYRVIRHQVKRLVNWMPTTNMVINAIVGTQRWDANELAEIILNEILCAEVVREAVREAGLDAINKPGATSGKRNTTTLHINNSTSTINRRVTNDLGTSLASLIADYDENNSSDIGTTAAMAGTELEVKQQFGEVDGIKLP
jgi:hypothetical protein